MSKKKGALEYTQTVTRYFFSDFIVVLIEVLYNRSEHTDQQNLKTKEGVKK